MRCSPPTHSSGYLNILNTRSHVHVIRAVSTKLLLNNHLRLQSCNLQLAKRNFVVL